jgi:hypothetical protein
LICNKRPGANGIGARRHKNILLSVVFSWKSVSLPVFWSHPVAAIDPDSLPKDVDILQKIVVDLCEQLRHESSEKNKYRSLLRELLDAQHNRKSEQLSKEQLALFETLWKASDPEAAEDEEYLSRILTSSRTHQRSSPRRRSAAVGSRWPGT